MKKFSHFTMVLILASMLLIADAQSQACRPGWNDCGPGMECVNCGSGPRCAVLPYECCGNDICGDGMVCAAVCGMGPICAVPPFQCCGWQICGEGMVCIRDATGARCGIAGEVGPDGRPLPPGGPGRPGQTPPPGQPGFPPGGPDPVQPPPHPPVDEEHAIPPFIDPSQTFEEVIVGPDGKITIITKEPPKEPPKESPLEALLKLSVPAEPYIPPLINPPQVSADLTDCKKISRHRDNIRSHLTAVRKTQTNYGKYLDTLRKSLDTPIPKFEEADTWNNARDVLSDCALFGYGNSRSPRRVLCESIDTLIQTEQVAKDNLSDISENIRLHEASLVDLSRLARREKCGQLQPSVKGELQLIGNTPGGHPSPYKDGRNPVFGTMTYTMNDGNSKFQVDGSQQYEEGSWSVTHTWEAPFVLPPEGETVTITLTAVVTNVKLPGHSVTLRPGSGLDGNNCSLYAGKSGGGKEFPGRKVDCKFVVRKNVSQANFVVVNGPHSLTYKYERK
jgi:hypothetical protein